MTATVELANAELTVRVDVAAAAEVDPDLQEKISQVEQALARIAPALIEAQEVQRQDKFDKLVALFVGEQDLTPLDIVRARMKANALRAVYNGTEWLTAAQVAEFAGLGNANPSGTVNRWKQRGKVFALQDKGQDHYPRYLLDDHFQPIAAAAAVLAALVGFSADRLAAWFESRTGLLDGRRPRELLATAPAEVLEAARRTVDAELHAA